MIIKDILVGFPEEFFVQRQINFKKPMMLNRGRDPKNIWEIIFLITLILLILLIIFK
jgi:hypothetical protein